MAVGTTGTLSMGVGEASFVSVRTVGAEGTGLFASCLFLFLADFCLAGRGAFRSDVEQQLAGSEESRAGGTELRPDGCFDADRTGMGGTAE